MPDQLVPEWRDINATRRYPFGDEVTLRSSQGDVISDSAFVDAKLFPVGGGARQYISSIVKDVDLLTFSISDETAADLGSGSATLSSSPATIELSDQYGRSSGVLVPGPQGLSTFAGWSDGTYTFSLEATELVSSVVVPVPDSGVRAIIAGDLLFSGDVWLYGKDGVVLTEEDGNVRIDVVGDPLYLRKACDEENSELTYRRFLQTINGFGPDLYGGFLFFASDELVEDPAIKFEPIDGGLKVKLVATVIN